MRPMMTRVLAALFAVTTIFLSAQEPVTGDRNAPGLRLYLPEEVAELSSTKGQKSAILFVNRLGESVTLFWLRDNGDEVRLGSLAADTAKEVQTFDGRVWIVKGANERTIGAFRALRDTRHALIGHVPPAATLSAQEKPLLLQLPVGGIPGEDWVINNYVDHDRTAGLRDYQGGATTYNGHKGTDFDVPNFRWMDNDFPISAAAPGRVVKVHDGEYDRNMLDVDRMMNCSMTPNLVEVVHASGIKIIYAHFKKDSVEVSVGEDVQAGQRLGIIGSSGCSTHPHLHLELRDERGVVVDPFVEGLWADPPPYDIPTSLMDYSIDDQMVSHINDLRDPPVNIREISPGSILSVGLAVAGIRKNARVRFVVRNGSTVHSADFRTDGAYGGSQWAWNFRVNKTSGVWHVEAYIDGRKLDIDHEVRVVRR